MDLFSKPEPNESEPGSLHLFVDEAGDPNLFHSSGKPIVGTAGCSGYFMLGKLEVGDPDKLASELTHLRGELCADDYFAGVESFRPERKKTALLFHAKDDLPEVRYRVFNLLKSLGKDLRFHAVVCDKKALLAKETKLRETNPAYRYRPDDVYDSLVRSLFSRFHRLADVYQVNIAKRGQSNRNQAIEQALEHAEKDFEATFGFGRKAQWSINICDPRSTLCLQAVDYFLWALQRFYEIRRNANGEDVPREDRFLKMLWPQMAEIHDLHFGPPSGTFYTPQKPLLLEERFGKPARKRKNREYRSP
jgi:hypothetical protein